MSKKNWSNILGVLARTALAFVFGFAQTAWAGQSRNVKDKPGSNAAAKSQRAPRNPSTSGGKAQPAEEETAIAGESSPQESPHRDGHHEGIAVHGHWTIEVHNIDGSLARHVEFENSLDPGFMFPSNPPSPEPGGAAYLSGVLSGLWAAPGETNSANPNVRSPVWFIILAGASGLNTNYTGNNSPCVLGSGGASASNQLFAGCGIIQNTAGNPCLPSPGFSCNLSVVPLGTAPNLTGLQLTGSIVALNNGQINTVATLIGGVFCLSYPSSCPNGNIGTASFTSSTNFQGAPISVLAGQTVAVTVNISFS